MPIKTAVDLPSVETIREMGSQKTGFTAFVTDKRTVHNIGGRTVISGEMDPGRAPGRLQDKRFEQATEAMRNRHADTGVRAATVVNLLPVPLVVNSPMTDMQVRIPACNRGDGFTSHTWEKPAIEVLYVGEGVNMPYDFMPLSIARAYEREYKDFGGVFVLHGYPDEDTLARPEVREQFKVATTRMHTWMLRKVEEANGMWNTLNHVGQAGIGDIHRECAHTLFDLGMIPSLPQWIQSVRSPDQVAKACVNCGTVPNLGAAVCIACKYVIDPAAAYRAGSIDEQSGDLERLTRAEVIDLGISAFVAETIDEKSDRLAAGLPKPKSLAQRNAEKAARKASKEDAAAGPVS